MTTATTDAPVRNDQEAHALLRDAHAGAYRFPEGFAGFEAGLTFTQDGQTTTGTVRVRGPRAIELESAEGLDEVALGWLRQELGSMAGHRWSAPYEAGDGRWTQTLGPDDGHPLGRQVLIHDDPFASSYRVRDGRIGQVNRQMGSTRFTITIQGHQTLADGRTLPAAFSVAFWDAEQGRLTRADVYADRYATVNGVELPAARRVATASDDGLTVRELVLSDHRLLDGEAETGPTDAVRRAG